MGVLVASCLAQILASSLCRLCFLSFCAQIGFDNETTFRTRFGCEILEILMLGHQLLQENTAGSHNLIFLDLSLRFERLARPIRIVEKIEFAFMDILIACESEGCRTQYSGSGRKNSNPGFGLNILDLQHWPYRYRIQI